ncbi:MAG: xanthan lyase [Bacteroidaceae bacterium]|nr:xanthan lyase [Bacteroidaceae bacterium]
MKRILLFLLTVCQWSMVNGQWSMAHLDSCVCLFFDQYQRDYRTPLPVALDHTELNDADSTLLVFAKEGFASQVFTPAKVRAAYDQLRSQLPEPYNHYKLQILGFNKEISTLIPNIYRTEKDSTRMWVSKVNSLSSPWTQTLSRPFVPIDGLQGCHLTVWPSHGRYFDNTKKTWRWQRPNLWCTTEDMFTRSIVVPFLLPMLESAGAVAYCPRERDWHSEEWIDDSVIGDSRFMPDISSSDDYAVYVRYPVANDAATDAVYTIRHGGVATQVRVNQQMGGGTWVYLGTFHFTTSKGIDNSISLQSSMDANVLPSEVRIGGGMGSVERGGKLSGMPRFLEGSRYWAEYAGFPQYVYDTKDGNNDYADDINVRSNILNYLAGGSIYVPDTTGMKVPFELSLAFHSDAGWFKENKPYGTLTIYTINGDNDTDTLRSGLSRMANSDLACIVQDDICRDLSAALGQTWPHREIFNRNYSESRKPEVPSIILESMSHQNFQDMLYAHDPNFKMIFARSVYKAIVRFVATQHGRDYTIQPLPVTHFKAEACDSMVHLSWRAQTDSLEPTAEAKGFIVYTAKEGCDFDNGQIIESQGSESKFSIDIPVEKDKIYRFRVTAYNNGGESWPSETLAALCASKQEEQILVVNGFTRLSSPAVISTTERLGFDINSDIGVPYINTAEYCGAQQGFNRSNIGSEAKDGLGFSGSELEGKVIAGNNFDYPYIHAQALRSDQYTRSISSCSLEALLWDSQGNSQGSKVENRGSNYSLLDLIFGLQKDCGNSSMVSYKTLTPALQQMLDAYLESGGCVLISGSYVGSDMQGYDERDYTAHTLGYVGHKSTSEHKLRLGNTRFSLVHEWNPHRYAAKRVDVLQTVGYGEPFISYHNGDCAAVATANTIVMGFPFEAISDADDRHTVMNRVVQKLLYKF